MFGVSRAKKINKFQMFIIFFCFQTLLDEIKRSFWWSDLDLSNIKQERKYFWSISESFQTRVLKWILTNPWINENQIEILFTPYISHSLRIQTRHFLATIKINWTSPAWYIAWRDCANFPLCHTTCFAGSISWNQN